MDLALVCDACTAHKYTVFGVTYQLKFQVLTVGGDQNSSAWKLYSFCPPSEIRRLPFRVFSQLFFYQTRMHWLTMDIHENTQQCYCVYSFSFLRKTLIRTRVPPQLLEVRFEDSSGSSTSKRLHLISQVRGSLCLIFVFHHQLQMLVLEDMHKTVWTRSHKICLQSLPGSSLSNQILSVAMRGVDSGNLSDIVKVLIHNEDELLVYDLKTQELMQVGLLSKDQKLCTQYFFHSNTLASSTCN